jgi:hypothetical protein
VLEVDPGRCEPRLMADRGCLLGDREQVAPFLLSTLSVH